MRSHSMPFFAFLLLAGCGATTPPPSGAPGPAPTPSASTSVAPITSSTATAAAPKSISLSPLGAKAVTVPVGTILTYSYNAHASVGYGASYTLAAQTVVRFERDDMQYAQSEAARDGKPGADAGTGTFVFKALAKGSATLTVDEQFRGTKTSSTTFTITIE